MLKNKKGVSLYLAVLILAILTAIGFGLSSIILPQLKIVREMGDSVLAILAADTGIEKGLFCLRYPDQGCEDCTNFAPPFRCQGNLGDASFEVWSYATGTPECPSAQYYCLKSIGTYKETYRSLEASF